MKKSFKIISVIVIASAVAFCGCDSKRNTENTSTAEQETLADTASDPDADVTDTEFETAAAETPAENSTELLSDTTESENNPEENFSETVSIVTSDGTVRELSICSPDDVNRPASLKGTEVFIGWEENEALSRISDSTRDTGEPIVLNAESENISDTENAIFNDTIYAEKNAEFIEIPVTIGGKTNFSVLDLEITFDTSLFSFDSFSFADSDAECNYTDDGKILVSFVSTENITADVNLCSIKLKKISTDRTETRLHYNVMDIAAWNEEFTDYVSVTYSIVNDKIVVY